MPPWTDLFSFTPKTRREIPEDEEPEAKKPKVGFRLNDREVERRFAKRVKMVGEIAPDYAAFVRLRPEFNDVVRRLVTAWKFYRSSGFSLRNRRHEDSLITELNRIQRELHWFKYLSARDERTRANWAGAKEWVWSDNAEYESELMKTLSMSAPRRRGESLDDWLKRLRMIRAGLGASPSD